MYDGMKSGRERAHALVRSSGYDMAGSGIPKKHPLEAEHHMAKGGHPDEAADKALIKRMVGKARIHLKEGGSADGEMEHKRLDRRARGGKSEGGGKHGKTQINIGIASPHPGVGGPGMGAPPGGAMPPPRPPMAAPPVAAPPRPMPPPPGAMPPGMPPGAMGGAPPGGMPMRPPGIKTGGRPHRKDGGEMMGDGGASAHLGGGSGSGRGRLDKKEREHAERWGTGA